MIGLELFPCSGGLAEGFRRVGIRFDFAFDYSEDACESYEANLGHRPVRMDVRDLLRLVRAGWRPTSEPGAVEQELDLLVADPPCFPPGTMITTAHGRVPIEDIKAGDLVQTHTGKLRSVVQTFAKPFDGSLVELTPQYMPAPIRCTPEHPVFVRRRTVVTPRPWVKDWWTYEQPEWMAAADIRVGDAVLVPTSHESPPPRQHTVGVRLRGGRISNKPSRVEISSVHVAWLCGLYVAEGHRRGREPSAARGGLTRREVLFSIANDEVAEVERRASLAGEHVIVSEHGTSVSRAVINSPDWWALCAEFGDGAEAKALPAWVYGMKLAWREAFLAGYMYGDGHRGPNSGGGTLDEATTVSEELAWGIFRLVIATVGVVPSLRRVADARTAVIEGRIVQCKPQWRVRWSPPVGRRRGGQVDDRGAWIPIRSIAVRGRSEMVHNLEVADDNSYVAGGIAVHNCTPWSRAGKRKGIEDERDMLVETVELIALLRPAAYLIGNVPGLNDADQWKHVQKYIGGLIKYGYCVRDYAQLDAAAYGVPQHRIRPFWYGHLRGPCVVWPEPSHGEPTMNLTFAGMTLKPYVTCRQALGHLPLKELGRPVRIRRRTDGGHPPSQVDQPAQTVLADTPRQDKGGAVLAAQGTLWGRVAGSRKKKAKTDPGSAIDWGRERGQGVVLENDKHPFAEPDAPAGTIRSGGAGHSAPQVVMAVDEVAEPLRNHPISDPDEPSMVIKTNGGRASQAGSMMTLPDHGVPGVLEPGEIREVLDNAHHPASNPDRPSQVIGAKSRGNGACALRLENENQPPAPPDDVHRTITAAGRGHQAAVQWPWDRPATTVQRDERLGAPGHHDENWQTKEGGRPRSSPNAVILSERAAKILQGFPESWSFKGKTKKSRWAMLGMAMPPPLAEAVASGVRRQLEASGVVIPNDLDHKIAPCDDVDGAHDGHEIGSGDLSSPGSPSGAEGASGGEGDDGHPACCEGRPRHREKYPIE